MYYKMIIRMYYKYTRRIFGYIRWILTMLVFFKNLILRIILEIISFFYYYYYIWFFMDDHILWK